MRTNRQISTILLAISLSAGFARAQQKASEDPMSAAPQSGKQMFQTYCAACHGAGAKGDGPAAIALKTPPPDLTLLSRKSGGRFPLMKVSQVIQGDVGVVSHGTREMPIYGDLFRDLRRDEAFVKLRVGLLAGYIQSIQVK